MLRVSLGNFVFFTILAVLMIGIKDQKDPRDQLHHGGWMAKIVCWFIVVFLMFFVPNGIISFYGEHLQVLIENIVLSFGVVFLWLQLHAEGSIVKIGYSFLTLN